MHVVRLHFLLFGVLAPFVLLASLSWFPNFWVHLFMTADFFTPWVLFESPYYQKYHDFLVSRLPDRPEIPIPELDASNVTMELVKQLGHGFTFPVVIRGIGADSEGVKKWGDHKWWEDNYGSEEILCGTLDNVRLRCTITDFFQELQQGKAFYVSGASKIFSRHPELKEMVDTPLLKSIEPTERTATQIFLGVNGMGSDIHSAIGINVFRQMAGTKKWWFVPPSQTAFILPSINVNGFSAHTHTMVGKMGEPVSPWMSKIERYTATLRPGDVVINPPWFWHGILNEGDKKDLVIGVPTRYGGAVGVSAALRSNWYLTLISMTTKLKNRIMNPEYYTNINANDELEDRIQENRLARMKIEDRY